MAQGQLKKKATSTKTGRNTGGITKKHLGNKNPKSQKLIKAQKINKKFTSGLTAQTEKMLGERAGHLELLGQKKKSNSTEKGVHGKKGGEKRQAKTG